MKKQRKYNFTFPTNALHYSTLTLWYPCSVRFLSQSVSQLSSISTPLTMNTDHFGLFHNNRSRSVRSIRWSFRWTNWHELPAQFLFHHLQAIRRPITAKVIRDNSFFGQRPQFPASKLKSIGVSQEEDALPICKIQLFIGNESWGARG